MIMCELCWNSDMILDFSYIVGFDMVGVDRNDAFGFECVWVIEIIVLNLQSSKQSCDLLMI